MLTFRPLFIALVCLSFAGTAAADSAQIADLQRKGADWLLSRQIEDGSWLGQSGQPAFTALACIGLYDCPQYQDPAVKAKIDKALDYLIGAAKPDGGIYGPSSKGKAAPEGRRGPRGGGGS